MEIRDLSPEELARLYRREMTRAFPPQELKPLSAMLHLLRQGRYRALGLWLDGEPASYALVWQEPDLPLALLDYLGTLPRLRGGGLGGKLLELLPRQCPQWQGLLAEVEAPEGEDPASLPRRRLAFYARHGFRELGQDCALFGVRYRLLLQGGGQLSPAQALACYRAIYTRHFPPRIYQRCIQIPLAPGEAPHARAEWIEE